MIRYGLVLLLTLITLAGYSQNYIYDRITDTTVKAMTIKPISVN